jgi:hypothetical protein
MVQATKSTEQNLLEKLTVIKLPKTNSASYENKISITAFAGACQWFLSQT